LWLGVLGGPILWLAQLIIGYGFVTYACDHGARLPLYVLGIGAALLTIVDGVVAWRLWRRATNHRAADLDEPVSTITLLGGAGVFMGLLFLYLIVLTTVGAVFLDACPLITLKMP
jgi:hypothetical protein